MLVVIFTGFIKLILAQEIVKSEYIWSNLEEHCHSWGSTYTTEYFHFDKDTIINDTNYKKIWISQEEGHMTWDFFGAHIREEGKKVYYRPYFGDEGLIYDFTLEMGDSVLVDNPRAVDPVWLTLTNIDTIETEFGDRERWKMESSLYPEADYWIVGIGSTAGILNSSTSVFGGLCGLYELLCQEDNGNLSYSNPEYQTCYLYTVGVDRIMFQEPFARYVPNTKSLEIDINEDYGPAIFLLFDINGNIIKKESNISNPKLINMSDRATGIYILTLKTQQGIKNFKFVKNN